ncbi:MAG: helix-turn-helix domain-containing protein [Kiritimatiellia bacterium]
MGVSYKKLWKLLIDKEMNKTELRLATGLSSATIARLTRSDSVSMDVLMRLCKTLNCNVGDIMDIVQDNADDSGVIHNEK